MERDSSISCRLLVLTLLLACSWIAEVSRAQSPVLRGRPSLVQTPQGLISQAPNSRRQVSRNSPGSEEVAVVVPVSGEISFRTVALVTRAVREAKSMGASRLILEIDTPGGLVTSMEEIVAILNQFKGDDVDTVAFISRQGLSAGTYIALACKRVFMASGATIGAATPIVGGGLRGQLEPAAYKKLISALRAQMRSIASRHGEKVTKLAEAMVDADYQLYETRYSGEDGLTKTEILSREEVDALQARKVRIDTQVALKPNPLTLVASEALRLGVAGAICENLDDVLRELDVERSGLTRIEPNWSEELANFLYQMRFFLLVGAVVLLVVAMKIPGTGVPEVLSLLLFLLFFGGTWLVGLAAWTEILLFALGVTLILVEIFVIPGTLISGILGFLAVVASLFFSLQPFLSPSGEVESQIVGDNLWNLILVILAVTAISGVLVRFLPKIPLFEKLLLSPEEPDGSLENSATREQQHAALVGRRAIAITALRPAGKVEIEGEPYDVVSLGAFFEAGAELQVSKVEGNRILVEAWPEGTGGLAAADGESGEVSIPVLVLMLFGGLLFLVAEVFFPSFGVLSICAAISIVTTVFLSFQHGVGVGLGFLLGVGVSAPVVLYLAFRFLPRTGMGKRLILDGASFDPKREDAGERGLEALVGSRGKTLTPLRPSGTILVAGRRVDALTRGEILDEDTDVEILSVELSQVIVRATRDGNSTVATDSPAPPPAS